MLQADVRYFESSALLAALLEHDMAALSELQARGRIVTSALTFAEARRSVIRARTVTRLAPAEERAALVALQTFERRCYVAAVTDAVLARVGRPFPVEPVRTLDGVHLATIELLSEAPQFVTVVTRDERVRRNAQALGYRVV